MARIMSITDSITKPSGFGNVIRNILFRLARLDHEVYHLGLQNTDGLKLYDYQFDDQARTGKYIVNLPTYGSSAGFGKPEFEKHFLEVRPDIVLTVMDLYMCQWLMQYKKKYNFIWICYLPIDGEPLPEYWSMVLPHIDLIVAMSEYGERLLNEAGYRCAMVPHGVSDLFEPDAKRGAKFRDKFSIPDDFTIYLFLNRNQHRKNIPDLVDAYTMFSADKFDTYLYFHCAMKEDIGWNIPVYLRSKKVSSKCAYTTGVNPELGVDLSTLIDIYNIADVFVSTTTGEGFGLTTLEAMACAKPVIITDYTTSEELIGDNCGIRIPVDRMVRLPDKTRGVYAGYPDVNKFAEAMQFYYDNVDIRIQHGLNGRKKSQLYRWDDLVPIWHALIHAMMKGRVTTIRDALDSANLKKLEVA